MPKPNLATGESSSIPCNCNRAVLCFIPGLIWVLFLGELFFLFTRIAVHFYSLQFAGTDWTQTTAWNVVSPWISGIWIIFWAIVTQADYTSKTQFLQKFALIGVKNMFPG